MVEKTHFFRGFIGKDLHYKCFSLKKKFLKHNETKQAKTETTKQSKTKTNQNEQTNKQTNKQKTHKQTLLKLFELYREGF